MKTFNNKKYRSEKSLVKDLKKSFPIIPTYINFKNNIFTQDNYDMNGKEITFGNVETEQTITLETSNRYLNGFNDLDIFVEDYLIVKQGFNYLR